MEELEKKLGYAFRDKTLLRDALTHSSYANENRDGSVSNERLEFLGDAVLGLVTARYFFLNRPDLPEGNMTRLRAELVCERNLDRVAEKLALGSYIRFGKGERALGGSRRPSIIADAVEALLAALYLDGGMAEAERFVRTYILLPYEAGEMGRDEDFKTELQELVQRKSGQTLRYELTGTSGPDHAKTFAVRVLLNGEPVGAGSGRTKKDAEQAAAKNALEGMR